MYQEIFYLKKLNFQIFGQIMYQALTPNREAVAAFDLTLEDVICPDKEFKLVLLIKPAVQN